MCRGVVAKVVRSGTAPRLSARQDIQQHEVARVVLSTVDIAPVADAMNRDGIGGFLEEDAVIADTKPQEALEFAGERLNAATASFGVAVNGFEDGHGDMLRDRADLGRDLGSKRIRLTILSWPRGSVPW